MQISRPEYTCPYLWEGDILSLSLEFRVSAGYLNDVPLGTRHMLHGKAATILDYLRSGIPHGLLLEHCEQCGVDASSAHGLLGFLNTVGALKVQRSVFGRCASLARQVTIYLRTSMRCPALTERHTFSSRQLALMIIRSAKTIILSSLLVTTLVTYGLHTDPYSSWLTCFGSLALLLVSTFMHEYAHYVFIAAQCVPVVLFRRGMRLGLLHPTTSLSSKAELQSAFAGPIAGACVCLLVASSAIAYHCTWPILTALCLALIHISSLLPWYGDGKSIMRLLSQRNSHANS